MSLTVTAHDNETGEEQTAQVPDGDYLIVCTDPATYSIQAHGNGTHVITVKRPRPQPKEVKRTVPE